MRLHNAHLLRPLKVQCCILCSAAGTGRYFPCPRAETQTPGVHSVPHFPLCTLPGRMGTSSKGLKGSSSSVLISQLRLWVAELLSTRS